jgi:hypothetical protein
MNSFFEYFIRVFKKQSGGQKSNLNLKLMHGINRISIVMFAFALLVMLYRALFR